MQIIVLDVIDDDNYYKKIIKTVSDYFNIPMQTLFLKKDDHGKPFLSNHENIHISISHSKNHLLYGISTREIGVDIEVIRPIKDTFDKIKYIAFHEEELSYIQKNEQDIEIRFLEIWTKKEAFLKCLGTGLNSSLSKINTLDLDNMITVISSQIVYSVFVKR